MLRWQKWLVGSGIISGVAVMVFISMCYSPSGIEGTLGNQLAALKAGDLNKAYSYTSKDFRDITSYKEFAEFIEHYPELRYNKGLQVFAQQDKKDGTVSVSTLLNSNNKEKVPVEFLMVEEDGQWKILGIEIGRGSDSHKEKAPQAATKEYDNTMSKYRLHYPSSWVYDNAGDATIIFSGKKGAPSYYTTVNIQTVLTKKTGGDFSTVKEFITDIQHQTKQLSPKTKMLDQGSITITEANGKVDVGQYMVFTYKYKGEEFKQWQVVFLRNDEEVFYAWAYTAPIGFYDNYLEIAKEMLKTWVIY